MSTATGPTDRFVSPPVAGCSPHTGEPLTHRQLKQAVASMLDRHHVGKLKSCSKILFERGSAEINSTALRRLFVVRFSR